MCTDNMPSGSALKLGDVLTMRNGKTVEIHNTDAEGRLVLADGLSLAVEEEPDAIVDIATLTGAVLSALGPDIAGLLGTNQEWVDAVKASSEKIDEPTWQLPLETKRYRKLLDSVVADMRNIGGPYAGTITATIFLSEFTGDVPYAHLDIAGPDEGRRRPGHLLEGRHRFRHASADRPRLQLRAARRLLDELISADWSRITVRRPVRRCETLEHRLGRARSRNGTPRSTTPDSRR